MKKLLITLVLISGLYAGSDDALFDLNLEHAFASAPFKVNSIGSEDLIMTGFSIGYMLDEKQNIYVTKGGAITQADSMQRPSPSNYVIAYEQLGYERILDFGSFIDLSLAIDAGSFIVSDGNNSSGISAAAEATAFIVINLTQSIKFQLGLGRRFSLLKNSDLVDMGLSKSDIDSAYYSFRINIGKF